MNWNANLMKWKQNSGTILVVLFILTLYWWGTAEADSQIEVGASQVGSEMSSGFMLTLTERINDRYDFTLGYISDQNFSRKWKGEYIPSTEWHVKAQIFVGAELLITSPWTDKLRLGIGPYVFQRPDRIGTDTFRVGLSLEYRFSDRFGIRARHFSLAGSGPEITICRETETWTNVPCDTPGSTPRTNDWNTGQDSWLRAVFYF